jgi:YbbR domain-containing protein
MALRDYVLDKFGWKVTSLVIALLIWMAIDSNNPDLRRARNTVVSLLPLRLPITIMKAATDDRSYRVSPGTVEVILGGNAGRLEKIRESDVEVFVNLKDVLETKRLRRKVQVYPPSDVSVVRVTPSDVSVEVLPAVEPPEDQKKD